NLGLEHKRIERAHIPDAVRDAIFGGNAKRLLKLE
ncbi:MAG: hypothetical protein LIQ31_10400, partial [Planctomycetes bacterium]|nr:hypothetical protein [Planctomycetota bacterium]